MNTTLIQPYVFFGGRCEEAMAFYGNAIGAVVQFKMLHSESPEAPPPGMLAPGFESKVMHATIRVGEATFMASDGCNEGAKFDGFRLSLAMPTITQADEAFAALAEGGSVQMPMTKTFWSPRFGMVTDKFGIGWMVTINSPPKEVAPASRELVITRLIDAPPEKLYRAWTQPDLLKQWFTPPPWKVTQAELDVRPGGKMFVMMSSPEGQEGPCSGVYLEVVENERLVWTDAYIQSWEPSAKPFMTAVITFEKEGGKTRYTAKVNHWTVADREAHEKMGFESGWGIATDQMVAIAATI